MIIGCDHIGLDRRVGEDSRADLCRPGLAHPAVMTPLDYADAIILVTTASLLFLYCCYRAVVFDITQDSDHKSVFSAQLTRIHVTPLQAVIFPLIASGVLLLIFYFALFSVLLLVAAIISAFVGLTFTLEMHAQQILSYLRVTRYAVLFPCNFCLCMIHRITALFAALICALCIVAAWLVTNHWYAPNI